MKPHTVGYTSTAQSQMMSRLIIQRLLCYCSCITMRSKLTGRGHTWGCVLCRGSVLARERGLLPQSHGHLLVHALKPRLILCVRAAVRELVFGRNRVSTDGRVGLQSRQKDVIRGHAHTHCDATMEPSWKVTVPPEKVERESSPQ